MTKQTNSRFCGGGHKVRRFSWYNGQFSLPLGLPAPVLNDEYRTTAVRRIVRELKARAGKRDVTDPSTWCCVAESWGIRLVEHENDLSPGSLYWSFLSERWYIERCTNCTDDFIDLASLLGR
jgi:hypothetical protein